MPHINIGDQMVDVPDEYLRQESLYTREELNKFHSVPEEHPLKEHLRQAVLDKRVEFYKLYLSGKVKLP